MSMSAPSLGTGTSPVTAAGAAAACLVSAALGLASSRASAAGPGVEAFPPDARAANDLGTVTVTARLPRPLHEAAASVTVADTSALDALVVRDLADLTRYEPGLTLRRDATRFGSGDFAIRGIGGNRVLIEVDGVPAAPGFAVGNFADAGRAYLDLDLVKRVEVLKGPASSLYGSEALGGVVSLQSFDPEDVLDGAAAGLRARTAWRGDDGGVLGSAIGALRLGSAALQLGYAHREASGLDNSSATLSPNPQARRSRAWLAKAVMGAASPLRITLQRQAADVDTDVRSLLLQPGRFANTIAMRGNDRSESTLVSADQRFGGTGQFDQAVWRGYWRRSVAEQDTHEERRAAGPRTPAVALFREFRFEDVTFGAEATVSSTFRALGVEHEMVAGFEAERSRVEEQRDGLQTTAATGVTTKTILGENFPLRDFPLSRTTRAGVYLQDRIGIGARSAWIPGMRVDHYRLEPDTDPVYSADNPRTTPVALRHTSVSPRLGYTWAASEGVTLYGQYSHGFRSPPFEDVNVGLDLPLFNTRAIPNPDLRPEKSDGIEVGARAERGPVRGSASAFYNVYRDFIESKANLGPDTLGTTIFQSRNLARARIWGVEAAGTWDLSGPAAEGFYARTALFYSRGDDTARDRPLNFVAPAKAVVGGGFASPSGRWGASLLTTGVAAKTRVDDGAAVLARAPGYVTFDLDAYWRPVAALELRIAVLNFADRSYFDWSDLRGKAAGDPSLELYRRPGRSVAASLTCNF